MKNIKEKRQKVSDTDKAIARPGLKSPKESKSEVSSDISFDTILAEKDEVKIAEEKLRQKNKAKTKDHKVK